MAEEKKAKKTQNQINIELPEELADGIYANLAIISHSHSGFVLDFIRMLPNVPKAKVKSRLIVTPEHAKRFLSALADNVKKYEAQHGTITVKKGGGSGNNFPPMNFTPTAQA